MADDLRVRAAGAGVHPGLRGGDRPGGDVGGDARLRGDLRTTSKAARCRTIRARAYGIIRREIVDGRRSHLIARDVYLLMGNVALASVYKALADLRRAGILRFVAGSGKQMELVPGAPERLDDGRGRAPGSVAARLAYGLTRRNTRASMATPRPVRGRAIVTG